MNSIDRSWLPPELLEFIFSFLEWPFLKNASLVCKSWNNAASHTKKKHESISKNKECVRLTMNNLKLLLTQSEFAALNCWTGYPDTSLAQKYDMFNIILLGAGGVGSKSALIVRFLQDKFICRYDPTIEDTYIAFFQICNSVVLVTFVDTAGQEEYSALRDYYVRCGDGFLLGYSITSHNSFDSVKNHYSALLRMKEEKPSIVLVGHKQDLEDIREVSTEQGKALADKWGCSFFETSAKTNKNINDCIITLVKLCYERRKEKKNQIQQKSLISAHTKKSSHQSCLIV